MKTIIAQNHRKNTILRQAAQANGGFVTDMKVESLSVILQEETDTGASVLLTLSRLLRQAEADFPIYREMFCYPVFIEEILQFTRECILYGITPQDLPQSTGNEKELAEILKLSMTLDLVEKKNCKNSEKLIAQLVQEKNMELQDQFLSDPYHYRLYEKLKEKLPFVPYPAHSPAKELRYTTSSGTQMEAVAQDICIRNTPCNVILTDSAAFPLLKNVFSRYHIPFGGYRESQPLHIPEIFYRLVLFGLKKDRKTFLDVIRINGFNTVCEDGLYEYLLQTLQGPYLPDTVSDHIRNDMFAEEAKYCQKYEEKAEAFFQSIQEDLDLMLSEGSVGDILFHAYSVIRKSTQLRNPAELKSALNLRNDITLSLEQIETEEDVLFFASCYKDMSASVEIMDSEFCTVTDLRHPVEPKEVTYVISVNSASYPGIPVKTGLFDELYLEKVKGYPDQSERYQEYTEQLKWVENSASGTLIYSYYTADYQGRQIQPAYQIVSQFTVTSGQRETIRQSRWILQTLKPAKTPAHTLTPDLSSSLFLREGKIHGSISTIERYFHCPYAYFIQSGLKVRKAVHAGIDARTVGNLQHAFMDTMTKLYGKEYALRSSTDIREFLTPLFDDLKRMYPLQTAYLDITMERIIPEMENALQFLQDFEKHTSFKPEHSEYRFEHEIIDDVYIHGIIDRIDTYMDQMFRILDYKSSGKALSEKDIKAGLQLQLLTYLIIRERETGQEPAGAFYYSLKNDTYEVDAAKASAKEITDTVFDEQAENARYMNHRTLKGWRFNDRITEMDENQNHISPAKNIYDYEMVKDALLQVYTLFKDNLLNGEIPLEPDTDACNFCDYHSICRFSGQKREKKALVYEKENFKL